MAEPAVLTIHTDGAARGNPGPAACSYVIARDGAEPIEEAECLGKVTNNVAEYTALVRALERALELGPHHRLLIHSDSELMVKQMNGEYRVKSEDLRDLYEQAQRLRRRFDAVIIRHVRREQNSRADALCNEVLDGKRLPPVRLPAAARAPVAAPVNDMRADALGCLRQAVAAWREGGGPSAERVWQELETVLRRHGVTLPTAER